ncbi:hypothetical protein D3C87_2057080 [compost metagenome]
MFVQEVVHLGDGLLALLRVLGERFSLGFDLVADLGQAGVDGLDVLFDLRHGVPFKR